MSHMRFPPVLWTWPRAGRLIPALVLALGYLIGSLPTAGLLGRMWGIDLRTEGSRNPGTNNARRLAGYPLAAAVLFTEIGKGAIAVLVGSTLGGDLGAALGGVGAATGNVFNVWYSWSGGKGLGISAGILVVTWPPGFLICLGVLIVMALITRSSGRAAIATLLVMNALAVVWVWRSLPTGWGIDPEPVLLILSGGLGVVLWPKHWRDASFRSNARSRNPAPS